MTSSPNDFHAHDDGFPLSVSICWTLPALELAGDLDCSTAPLLREAAAVVAPIVTDCLAIRLTDLRFIDAAGLAALEAVDEALAHLGKRAVLDQLSPLIRRRIEAFGSDGLVAAALRGIAAGRRAAPA